MSLHEFLPLDVDILRAAVRQLTADCDWATGEEAKTAARALSRAKAHLASHGYPSPDVAAVRSDIDLIAEFVRLKYFTPAARAVMGDDVVRPAVADVALLAMGLLPRALAEDAVTAMRAEPDR